MNKQSFDSEKFSKDGITVTTANPIYYNIIPESPADWYLSFDQSNSEAIKAFQTWLNKNHAGWATGYTNGVVLPTDNGFGMFGSLTQAAYKNYGDEYLATLATKPTTQPTATSQPTDDQIAVAKKSGLTWDKVNKKWQQLEQSGAVDTLLGLFGLGKKSDTTPTADDNKLKNPDKPMSTGAKIAIGVGAAAVLAIIIYAATKKSK